MTPQYTETVCAVNGLHTVLDIQRLCEMREDAGMVFSTNLARIRSERGLTQEQLAEKIGVQQPTVQRWEAGGRQPRRGSLEAIAAALEVELSSLFEEGDGSDLFPSEDELARMIQRAMGELPVGVTYADYPQAVSSNLHAQLRQYQAGGGYQEQDEEIAPDTGAPPPKPTRKLAAAKSRTP